MKNTIDTNTLDPVIQPLVAFLNKKHSIAEDEMEINKYWLDEVGGRPAICLPDHFLYIEGARSEVAALLRAAGSSNRWPLNLCLVKETIWMPGKEAHWRVEYAIVVEQSRVDLDTDAAKAQIDELIAVIENAEDMEDELLADLESPEGQPVF